jgi:hypothetical protein
MRRRVASWQRHLCPAPTQHRLGTAHYPLTVIVTDHPHPLCQRRPPGEKSEVNVHRLEPINHPMSHPDRRVGTAQTCTAAARARTETSSRGGPTATISIVSEAGAAADDPLLGWDPRRRAALERLWETFAAAGGEGASLSEELISEHRAEAAAEDHGASPS